MTVEVVLTGRTRVAIRDRTEALLPGRPEYPERRMGRRSLAIGCFAIKRRSFNGEATATGGSGAQFSGVATSGGGAWLGPSAGLMTYLSRHTLTLGGVCQASKASYPSFRFRQKPYHVLFT